MQRHLDGQDYVPWLPLPRNFKVNGARATLYRLARDLEKDGAGQTVDEILSVLFAGTESPVNTLCFALKLLEENPEWHQRLLAELEAQGKVSVEEDVEKFDLLAQVLSECIRLYPAGWAFERYASSEVKLGGETIPRGMRLLFSPFLMHRNVRFWKEPSRFDPQRFTSSPNSAEGVPKFGYMPYGAGPRSCIGSRLAQMEMRITLRLLLENVRWKTQAAPGDRAVNAEGSFKIRLSRPMFMTFEFPRADIPQGTPAVN
jgi:cytochrome P450